MRTIQGIRSKISHLGLIGFCRKILKFAVASRNKNPIYIAKQGISYLRDASKPTNELSLLIAKFNDFEKNNDQKIINSKILIVIPIFNGLEMSKKCIESALESEPHAEIYAIDDCSTDDLIPVMLEKIREQNPTRFKWERNATNTGFVKNANKGLAYAKGRHVVLLNSDTVCTSNFASIMCQAFSTNLKIASVTPMTNAGEIANTPNIFEEVPQLDNDFAISAADLLSKLTSLRNVNTWPEIPTGVGFSMAINGNHISEIGFFDEIFSPGYGEENDWSIRAKKLGYRNLLCPIAYVHHNHGSSFGNRKQALVKRNLEILNEKYPSYANEIRIFQANDPLHYFRHWIFLFTIANTKKFDVRVIVDHFTGGGATATLMNEIQTQINTLQIVVHKINPKDVEFKILFGSMKSIDYRGNYLDFFKFIELMKPSKSLVNSTPFVSENPKNIFFDFIKQLTGSISSVEMRIHDYHSLCPSYNLIDNYGNYCDLPEKRICDNCLKSNNLAQPINNLDITEWRSSWSEIIKNVDQVTGYSSESLQRFLRIYPVSQENLFQARHSVIDHSKSLKRIMQIDPSNLRIATVGNLNHAKGSTEVINLAKAIKGMNKDHLILHFGEISGGTPDSLPISGIGRYRDSRDLVLKLIQHAPDIIFIPSIWPETFNLVSEELKNSEVPILMFRMGAPFERFSENNNFIFTDYKSGNDLLDFIEKSLSD